MPLTPDDGTRYAKTISDLYGQAVTDLLRVVARRLAKGIDEPGWAEAKLTETLRLRREAQAVVARLAGKTPAAIEAALTAAHDDALGTGVVATNRRAVAALARDLADTLTGQHARILRGVDDVYRQVVADTAGSLVTGTSTRRQATARALDRYATRGVGRFVDTAGRSWQLDTYAEMTARTAASRAYLAGGLERITGQGRDLVIVSDAPEECALCRPFEGRILSISGAEPTELPSGFRYAGTLDQATAAGLFHPNCRHSVTAYIPGLTQPYGRTADPDGDQLRQRQRQLERDVRESKRRIAAIQELGPTPQLARQQTLLKARQKRLRDFNDANERKQHVSAARTRVHGLPKPPPTVVRSARSRVPDGTPGATLRDLPGGEPGRWVTHAVRAIDGVHRVPEHMPAIPVKTFHDTTTGTQAQYAFLGEQGQGPGGRYFGSLGIQVNTASTGPHASILHEYGHFLDHRGIGGQADRFASATERDGLLAGFWRAVESTSTYRDLQAMKAHPAGTPWSVFRRKGEDVDRGMVLDREHVDYLLDPREVFARAYAQWIATRSGDRLLLEQIAAHARPDLAGYVPVSGGRLGYPYQWDVEDFAPVAAEFDAVFAHLGLLKEEP